MGTCILTRQSLPEDRDDSARSSAAQLGKVGAFDALSTKSPGAQRVNMSFPQILCRLHKKKKKIKQVNSGETALRGNLCEPSV